MKYLVKSLPVRIDGGQEVSSVVRVERYFGLENGIEQMVWKAITGQIKIDSVH